MEQDARLLIKVRCYDCAPGDAARALQDYRQTFATADGEEFEILSVTLLAEGARPLRADATDPNPED